MIFRDRHGSVPSQDLTPQQIRRKRLSIESAKDFLERVKNDEGLLRKLSGAQSGEGRLEIAKAEGFEFTKEEMLQAQSEINDDELASVSGGGFCFLDCRGVCEGMAI